MVLAPASAPTRAELHKLERTATTPGVRALAQSLIAQRDLGERIAAVRAFAEEKLRLADIDEEHRTRKASMREVHLAVHEDEDEAAAAPKPRGVRAELIAARDAQLARAVTFKHGDHVAARGHGPLVVERVGMSFGRPDGTVLCRLRDDPASRRRNFWFASTALTKAAP
jgi:hypothetical protein